jgi:DNA repair protein RadC
MLNMRVLDHLIISEKEFFSFADGGLLKELMQSTWYRPRFKIQDEAKLEIAWAMRKDGFSDEKIVQLTGLTIEQIEYWLQDIGDSFSE